MLFPFSTVEVIGSEWNEEVGFSKEIEQYEVCEDEERIIYISVCVCGYTHTRAEGKSNRVFVRFLNVGTYLLGKIIPQKKICFFHVKLVGFS